MITPSNGPYAAGDVLTCEWDGYPEPSYQWTDSNGVVVADGPNVTVNSSTFFLNCTATNLIDSCSESVAVSSRGVLLYYAFN